MSKPLNKKSSSKKKSAIKKKIAKKKELAVKKIVKSKTTTKKKVNPSSKEVSILEKLKKVYTKFVLRKGPNADSQLCEIWSMDPPDILESTRQIRAIEAEFNITIEEDDAAELFDMSLIEASDYILKMIELQKLNSF